MKHFLLFASLLMCSQVFAQDEKNLAKSLVVEKKISNIWHEDKLILKGKLEILNQKPVFYVQGIVNINSNDTDETEGATYLKFQYNKDALSQAGTAGVGFEPLKTPGLVIDLGGFLGVQRMSGSILNAIEEKKKKTSILRPTFA